ncbi:MAG: hypothetical protein ABL996_04740 [Micropepsaceae bacterium]
MHTLIAEPMRRGLLWIAAIGMSALAVFALAPEAGAEIDPSVKTASGMTVYLGVIPAPIVRGHPLAHPEATMHGGPPSGKSERHIVVALFDAKTFERITNADVEATVEGLGHIGAVSKKLERMDIADAPTFGNYFPFQGPDKYTVRLKITAQGYKGPVILEFTYSV